MRAAALIVISLWRRANPELSARDRALGISQHNASAVKCPEPTTHVLIMSNAALPVSFRAERYDLSYIRL